MCKKIHRGGNAEQYHADKKYKEAVAEAVEACADDTMMRSFSPRATADEIDAACDTLDPDGSGADRFMMQAIKHLTEAFDISHV